MKIEIFYCKNHEPKKNVTFYRIWFYFFDFSRHPLEKKKINRKYQYSRTVNSRHAIISIFVLEFMLIRQDYKARNKKKKFISHTSTRNYVTNFLDITKETYNFPQKRDMLTHKFRHFFELLIYFHGWSIFDLILNTSCPFNVTVLHYMCINLFITNTSFHFKTHVLI